MTKERPIGITILAILAVLAALEAFVYTLQMLHLLPMYIGNVAFYNFSLIGAMMWGFIVLIWLWVFRMLMMMEPQGWLFLVVISGLNLLFAFFSILGASSWQAMAPMFIINGIILLYCLAPGTKASFGIAP
jgi:hypothetical protein